MTEKKKVKTFTVDAKNWIRGEKFNNDLDGSCLLNSHGKMCCLGFFGEACGVDRENLKLYVLPQRRAKEHKAFPSWIYERFAAVNDNGNISDEERVKQLRELFKKKGVTVRFKNLPKGEAFTKPYHRR